MRLGPFVLPLYMPRVPSGVKVSQARFDRLKASVELVSDPDARPMPLVDGIDLFVDDVVPDGVGVVLSGKDVIGTIRFGEPTA